MSRFDVLSSASQAEVATYRQPSLARPAIRRRRASLLLTGEDTTAATALREGEPVVVGRASPSDLVIEDPGLSRQHARFTWCGNHLELEDLGSTNGTLVNGARVERAEVGPEDEVFLGSVRTVVHLSRFQEEARSEAPEGFRAAVRAEAKRARTFHRPFSLLALRRPTPSTPGWQRHLEAALRPVDEAASFGEHVALVLISEAGETDVRGWAERLRGTLGDGPVALGAATFPAQGDDVDALIAAALDASRRARAGGEVQWAAAVREKAATRSGPVLESPAIKKLYALTERAARTAIPVLVVGETGAGKELVAETLHARSPRAEGPFKAINCSTIPANLTESALFGHEKGAFTGANARAPGLFEQGHGGTVFLDEVGELPPQAQAALLRVLETKRITRVGGSREVEVDVRVIAATHRDLEAMVDEGTFRADLLYRLDAVTLEVPPLRERLEDIVPLAKAFLAQAAEQWHTPATEMDEPVLDALRAYAWPGNVRQLKNTVERAAAMTLGPRIGLVDLPKEVANAGPGGDDGRATPDAEGDHMASLTDRVDRFERAILRETLERTGGNQTRAAELLRVPRRTLAHKVKRHGLG